MSVLLQRIVTAVVLIACLLAILLLLPPLAGVVLIAAFLTAGGWEWAAFCGYSHPAARALYALLVALALGGGIWFMPGPAGLLPLLWISLFWWALALLAVLRYPQPIARSMVVFAGFLVLVPGGVTAAVLLDKLAAGALLVLLVLVIVWAADVGAYFAGRRYGRRRLAPQVSPGKTWAGVVGGLVAAVLVAVGGGLLLGPHAGTAMPVWFLILLGLAVAAISVLGDLTVSMFKRNVGLKDSGQLIPGHGGVLDRVDSITAAVPLYVLLLFLGGVITA